MARPAGGFPLAVWLLSPVLLPFVLGMAIGYVVDPGRRPPRAGRVLVRATVEQPPPIAHALTEAARRLGRALADLVADALGRGMALVNLVGLLSVTPLVAFYL